MGFFLVMLACQGFCSPSTAAVLISKTVFPTQAACEAKGNAIAEDIKAKAPEAIVKVRCEFRDNGGI